MQLYVIKSWAANSQPVDDRGTHVVIEGRAPGIIGWLLSVAGIAPTVRFRVTGAKVIFEQGSLAGNISNITALEKICTTIYGYTKPWAAAVVIGFVAFSILAPVLTAIVGPAGWVFGVLLGVGLAILYYVLNKAVIVGFTAISGERYAISFKRSVIEGQDIDEKAAQAVCLLIEDLIDLRRQTTPA